MHQISVLYLVLFGLRCHFAYQNSQDHGLSISISPRCFFHTSLVSTFSSSKPWLPFSSMCPSSQSCVVLDLIPPRLLLADRCVQKAPEAGSRCCWSKTSAHSQWKRRVSLDAFCMCIFILRVLAEFFKVLKSAVPIRMLQCEKFSTPTRTQRVNEWTSL